MLDEQTGIGSVSSSSKFAAVSLVLLICFYSAGIAKCSEPKSEEFFSPVIGEHKQLRYGKYLKAMDEKPLWNLSRPNNKYVFRLVWLRSFHHPIFVRIEKTDGGNCVLYARELSGAGGYAPGVVTVARTSIVGEKTFDAFLEKVSQLSFFEQPTNQDDSEASDGATWIFEINDHGKYHILDTFSGGKSKVLGLFLLREAKLLPEKHVY